MVGILFMCAVMVLHSDELRQANDWPLVHGDRKNDRYSTLNKINTNTVKQLGGAWVSKKFEDGASSRSSPVVKDGAMYVTAGTRVYALSAKTGETLWTWRSTVALSWQGVAVGEGLIFVGSQTERVEALDEKTGKAVWSQQIG